MWFNYVSFICFYISIYYSIVALLINNHIIYLLLNYLIFTILFIYYYIILLLGILLFDCYYIIIIIIVLLHNTLPFICLLENAECRLVSRSLIKPPVCFSSTLFDIFSLLSLQLILPLSTGICLFWISESRWFVGRV